MSLFFVSLSPISLHKGQIKKEKQKFQGPRKYRDLEAIHRFMRLLISCLGKTSSIKASQKEFCRQSFRTTLLSSPKEKKVTEEKGSQKYNYNVVTGRDLTLGDGHMRRMQIL